MISELIKSRTRLLNNSAYPERYQNAYLNRAVKFINSLYKGGLITPSITYDKRLEVLNIRSKGFVLRWSKKVSTEDLFSELNISVGDLDYRLKEVVENKIILNRIIVMKINFDIPVEDILNLPIHNKICLTVINKDQDFRASKQIIYSLLKMSKHVGKNKNIIILDNHESSVYLRQSSRNKLYLTVRERLITDSPAKQRLINTAWFVSNFVGLFWRPIIFYEKFSSKFEESSSIVFFNLKDKNTKNIYFILSGDHSNFSELRGKYGKSLLEKDSFLHYLAFFCSKKFIGTEMIAHSIGLRVANYRAVRKLVNKDDLSFIFLQHGVMYMVALSSTARKEARKTGNTMPVNSKIVVSSSLEADHFTVLGEYSAKDLYICGLPKFDRAIRNYDASKIVIMPTWRPWEYNIVREKTLDSGYYKMIRKMAESVPENLKDKLIILPHPLFRDGFKNTDLEGYLSEEKSYDKILKDTSLLITDYSSIAYDAFFRGSNVIFWWQDKDGCMDFYGGSLMINDKNIFGDIIYTKKDLTSSIRKNYGNQQSTKYKRRYSKIVEFHDNKNTERLVRMLKKDGFIK